MTTLPSGPHPRSDTLTRFLARTATAYTTPAGAGVAAVSGPVALVVTAALANLDLPKEGGELTIATVHAALLSAADDHDAVTRFFRAGHDRRDIVAGVRGLELLCADRSTLAATELRRIARTLLVEFAHDL